MALINQWKLENNANDSVGSYNLTATSVNYMPQAMSGNYYAKLNGTGSTIDGSYSNILANTNFSISAWHRVYSGTTGDIISFGNGSGGAFWQMFGYLYSGVYYLYSGKYVSLVDALRVNLHDYYYKWVHIAVTDSNGTINTYINGKWRQTSTNSRAAGTVSLVSVGSNTAGVTDYYGYVYIDDVRVYNHSLTATEVSQLYNSYFTEKAASFMSTLV